MPSREEVRAIARLARLAFTTEELDRMAGDLHGILAHVDALRHAVAAADARVARDDEGSRRPTDEVKPTVEAPEPLRADEPGADPLTLPPSWLAPEWRDGFFTVPRLPAHRDGG